MWVPRIILTATAIQSGSLKGNRDNTQWLNWSSMPYLQNSQWTNEVSLQPTSNSNGQG